MNRSLIISYIAEQGYEYGCIQIADELLKKGTAKSHSGQWRMIKWGGDSSIVHYQEFWSCCVVTAARAYPQISSFCHGDKTFTSGNCIKAQPSWTSKARLTNQCKLHKLWILADVQLQIKKKIKEFQTVVGNNTLLHTPQTLIYNDNYKSFYSIAALPREEMLILFDILENRMNKSLYSLSVTAHHIVIEATLSYPNKTYKWQLKTSDNGKLQDKIQKYTDLYDKLKQLYIQNKQLIAKNKELSAVNDNLHEQQTILKEGKNEITDEDIIKHMTKNLFSPWKF